MVADPDPPLVSLGAKRLTNLPPDTVLEWPAVEGPGGAYLPPLRHLLRALRTNRFYAVLLRIGPVDHPALADGHTHSAQHRPPIEGSIRRLGSRRDRAKGPFDRRVEEDHVGEGSGRQASPAA